MDKVIRMYKGIRTFKFSGWTFLAIVFFVWRLERFLSLSPEARELEKQAAVNAARANANVSFVWPYMLLAVSVLIVLAASVAFVLWAMTFVRRQWTQVDKGTTTVVTVSDSGHGVSDTVEAKYEVLSLPQGRTTLDNLTVGYTDDGQVVSSSITDLMHTLCVGSSGFGKSTWVRSLLYQIARCDEPILVVAIDCYGSEFNCMRDWDKLMCPVARTKEDAMGALAAINREIAKRQKLFEDYPLASKLSEYNEYTVEDKLCPILCVIDEGTALMNEGGIGDTLRSMVQTARQYGVYVMLLGQSVNYKVIETQTRDQFSSKICFRVPPSSSKVVLDDRCAGSLNEPGVAYAILAGKPVQKIRSPFVSREQFYGALTSGGPANVIEYEPETDDIESRVIAMHDEGKSKTAIAKKIFGCGAGSAFYKVSGIIDNATTTESVSVSQ